MTESNHILQIIPLSDKVDSLSFQSLLMAVWSPVLITGHASVLIVPVGSLT